MAIFGSASVKEKMQSKLRSATGKALFAARAHCRTGIGQISCAGNRTFCCVDWRRDQPSGD